MATTPSTRSGCSAAAVIAQAAPQDSATSTAWSSPVASMTAITSAVHSAFEYAAAPTGRLEPPVPRPSYVTTRWCRDR